MALLAWITFAGATRAALRIRAAAAGVTVAANLPAPVYRRILVPLDHIRRDRAAIAHAAAMARLHGATLHLLHVEEGATSQLFGALASDAEIHAGEEYFQRHRRIAGADRASTAELTVAHGSSPKDEIVQIGARDSSRI